MLLLNTTGLKTLVMLMKELFVKKDEIVSTAPSVLTIKSSNKTATISNLETGTYVVVDGEIDKLIINKLVAGEYTGGKESYAVVQFIPVRHDLEEQYNISINEKVVWNLDQTNNVLPGAGACKLEIRLVDGIYYAKLINYVNE